jgi:acetylornithine deacetylase/succinyl-diaminopimelate desuccinylase-like protein
MKDNGFNPVKQEVVKDRFNVFGRLKGSGDGVSLLFNSHLDTSKGLWPEDLWVLEEVKPEYTSAWRDGDSLVGEGIINCKGPLACFLIAAKAIRDSGVRLKGDIVLTAVMGEIGSAPVDEYQGPQYYGKGIGAKYLVDSGVVADYALVAEMTDFSITWIEGGDVWFKITVKGKGGIYSPFLQRPYTLQDNPNAIVKMAKVIEAIEEWAYEYEQKNRYEFKYGTFVPKVNIGAIRGGLPVRATQTPGVCSLYVEVRLPPGKLPTEAKRQLEQILNRYGFPYTIETYLFRMGYEGRNVEPLVEAAEAAHQTLFGKKPDKIISPYTSMWRDVNVFNSAGIPCITCGPRPDPEFRTSRIKIEDMLNGAKLYAIIAYLLCNQIKTRT